MLLMIPAALLFLAPRRRLAVLALALGLGCLAVPAFAVKVLILNPDGTLQGFHTDAPPAPASVVAAADVALAPTAVPFIVGDCNRDGRVDVTDLITQVGVLLETLPEYVCESAACFYAPELPPTFGINCLYKSIHEALTD